MVGEGQGPRSVGAVGVLLLGPVSPLCLLLGKGFRPLGQGFGLISHAP